MRKRNEGRSPARGFTLIELLVVVSIIAILASILLPVLGRARRKAVEITCAGNLRQLGTAVVSYADDCDGWYPNFDPGTTDANVVAGLRLKAPIPGNLGDYLGDPAVAYCPTSWFSAAKNWGSASADMGYTNFWARWEWTWTDDGGATGQNVWRDKQQAKFSLRRTRVGVSERFSFTPRNEPWLFEPELRLLAADSVYYRSGSGAGRYFAFNHRRGNYSRLEEGIPGYNTPAAVLELNVWGQNHVYEDLHVRWLTGSDSVNYTYCGVGGNFTVRATK